MDYKALGYELLELVGGKENISKLTHCATRLRFEFYDKSKVAVKKIETTPGVISVVDKGGQFQIVIGNEVQTTFRAIKDELGEGNLSNADKKEEKEKGNVIKLEHNQFVSTNRSAAVELRITMEAFGTEHKHRILDALEKKGFRPKQISAKLY